MKVTLILSLFFFFFFPPQPSNGLFLSALLVVLPLESLAHGLFHELGSCLGGTCVGYALVIPTAYCRYGREKETEEFRHRTYTDKLQLKICYSGK